MSRPLYTKFSIFYRISKKYEFLRKLIGSLQSRNDLSDYDVLYDMYSRTFDIIAEAIKNKDKKRIMTLIMNENCDAKLNRRIYDYLVCANTFKLSKKNLEEALENQEL
jgi:predicted transcriptional regulator